jgi:hypothetical protein
MLRLLSVLLIVVRLLNLPGMTAKLALGLAFLTQLHPVLTYPGNRASNDARDGYHNHSGTTELILHLEYWFAEVVK